MMTNDDKAWHIIATGTLVCVCVEGTVEVKIGKVGCDTVVHEQHVHQRHAHVHATGSNTLKQTATRGDACPRTELVLSSRWLLHVGSPVELVGGSMSSPSRTRPLWVASSPWTVFLLVFRYIFQNSWQYITEHCTCYFFFFFFPDRIRY